VYVPPNMTEASVLEAIEKVVNILAPNFAFGIYDEEDIKQEGRVFAMQCLSRYDGIRPLENFLYRHVKNRLINLKRNKFHRSDAPCEVCHRAVGRVTEHASGEFCEKYLQWRHRNAAKASLMRPVELEVCPNGYAQPVTVDQDESSVNELKAVIRECLDIELLPTYLQMLAGVSVPKARRLQVEEAVKEILREELYVE
jgi:DNA-directed RNA polymerase specialized sigma24 family protein